ncbi:hypothetical protein [Calidithermus timidus]|jgi:hypothetical protein|uniref:hypothetical protein n=1 Tax=Calidithermus timidus TaxID=307124 RepID=UPI00036DCFF9|nr:hypothetical protein [Calidithermus timidus]
MQHTSAAPALAALALAYLARLAQSSRECRNPWELLEFARPFPGRLLGLADRRGLYLPLVLFPGGAGRVGRRNVADGEMLQILAALSYPVQAYVMAPAPEENPDPAPQEPEPCTPEALERAFLEHGHPLTLGFDEHGGFYAQAGGLLEWDPQGSQFAAIVLAGRLGVELPWSIAEPGEGKGER